MSRIPRTACVCLLEKKAQQSDPTAGSCPYLQVLQMGFLGSGVLFSLRQGERWRGRVASQGKVGKCHRTQTSPNKLSLNPHLHPLILLR